MVFRWETNTPLTDIGQKGSALQSGAELDDLPLRSLDRIPKFERLLLPVASPIFRCGAPTPNCANTGTTPTGLVVPGDKGVPGD